MGLPIAEVQIATVTRLRGDATMQGLLAGSTFPWWNIYDRGGVPTLKAFPYVVIFPVTVQKGTALVYGKDATDIYLQISAYDQYKGFSRVRAIAAQIYALMQTYNLPLINNYINFFTLFENQIEKQEQDGITFDIDLRFHLMTQG